MKFQTSFSTPLGYVTLVAENEFLVALLFEKASQHCPNNLLETAQNQLQAYFTGKLHQFSLPYKIPGSDFQKKVLAATSKIKYSHTITYGQLAERIGKPNSTRAVGSALARNSLPIIIPCHRIVAKHGLGGYNGGLWRKSFLLDLENIDS